MFVPWLPPDYAQNSVQFSKQGLLMWEEKITSYIANSMWWPSCAIWHLNFSSVCMYEIPRLPLKCCCLAGYSPLYVKFIFLRCGVLYMSSALFLSYLPLHCLICLGHSVLVLFPSGPQGFISCATFINIPFFLPFTKVRVKIDHSLAKQLSIEPFILTGND